MDTKTLGITTANGYPFLSLEERFALYAKASFQTIMLWWGIEKGNPRQSRTRLAAQYGLRIENVHTDMENTNSLWLPGPEGEEKLAEYLTCVTDCKLCDISVMVLHLTTGKNPPPLSPLGLDRLERLFDYAGACGVNLAIENVRTETHIRYILGHYPQKHIGFCFDTGHANLWNRETDWLGQYGDRLFAVHLHDNDGTLDDHSPPFTGTVDWTRILKTLKRSSYRGSLTLETEYRGAPESVGVERFLEDSRQAGLKLAAVFDGLNEADICPEQSGT